jgi:sigma-E factor negative regulatory protein RseA
MSTTIAEHLSAVLDGEAGKFEQRRVLDELGKSNELQTSLSCYALIGETMRDTSQTSIADSNFLKGIHDKLDTEPEYSQVRITEKKVSNGHPAWARPIVGFAMAASVAAVAVIGVQNFMVTNGSNVSIAKNQQPIEATPLATTPYNHPDAKTHSLYKRYLDSHVKFASTTPIMPSVRMVSYNSNY